MGVENTTDFPTLVQTRSGSRVKEIRFPFLSLPKMKAPLVLNNMKLVLLLQKIAQMTTDAITCIARIEKFQSYPDKFY